MVSRFCTAESLQEISFIFRLQNSTFPCSHLDTSALHSGPLFLPALSSHKESTPRLRAKRNTIKQRCNSQFCQKRCSRVCAFRPFHENYKHPQHRRLKPCQQPETHQSRRCRGPSLNRLIECCSVHQKKHINSSRLVRVIIIMLFCFLGCDLKQIGLIFQRCVSSNEQLLQIMFCGEKNEPRWL